MINQIWQIIRQARAYHINARTSIKKTTYQHLKKNRKTIAQPSPLLVPSPPRQPVPRRRSGPPPCSGGSRISSQGCPYIYTYLSQPCVVGSAGKNPKTYPVSLQFEYPQSHWKFSYPLTLWLLRLVKQNLSIKVIEKIIQIYTSESIIKGVPKKFSIYKY